MTTLELNPIRMRPGREGRLTPVACDFKCGFDRDDPRWQRLDLPAHLFTADTSDFEHEVNQLRTHQGQSDVFVINPQGTILAPTFGGGANSLVTQVLGDAAIISSDFGGNPPYEKMKEVARICYKHWLKQANVLFIIGGKSNNTDIYETFRAMGDALARAFQPPRPVAALRGGRPRRTNLVRGMGALAETCDCLGLPYRIFGFDSAISEVVQLRQGSRRLDEAGGREGDRRPLGLAASNWQRRRGRPCTRRASQVFPTISASTRWRRGDARAIACASSISWVANPARSHRSAMPSRAAMWSSGPRRAAAARCCRPPVGDIPVYNNVREGLDDGLCVQHAASSTCPRPACATASPSWCA